MKSSVCLASILASNLCLLGCASTGAADSAKRDPGFELRIEDEVNQSRFKLTLISRSAFDLCLNKESWPDSLGFPTSVAPARLVWEGGSLESIGGDIGMCLGGCKPVVIPARSQIQGFVAYRAFGESAKISALSRKSLQFAVAPQKCSSEFYPRKPETGKPPY